MAFGSEGPNAHFGSVDEANPGSAGAWPGFLGSAPPDVAATGSAGATGKGADGGHTHRGVHSLNGLFGDITTSGGAVVGLASWTLANMRWYAVDSVNGSDANAGFSDVSAAAAGAVAKATFAGLAAIFPQNGNGHRVTILINSAGTYTSAAEAAALAQVLGSGNWGRLATIRGTVTNSTAASTAFLDDANDKIMSGCVTASGLNASGYNPTGTGTGAFSIQCTKVGGGAPGFTNANGLMRRLRWDANTTTAALRNKVSAVVAVSAGDTIVCRGPDSSPPGGFTFTAADVFYLEEPGVILAGIGCSMGTYEPSLLANGPATGGVWQMVGFGTTGNIDMRGGFGPALIGPTKCARLTTKGTESIGTDVGFFDDVAVSETFVGGGLIVTTSIAAFIGGSVIAQLTALYQALVVFDNPRSWGGAGSPLLPSIFQAGSAALAGITIANTPWGRCAVLGPQTGATTVAPYSQILGAGTQAAGLNVNASGATCVMLNIQGMGAKPAIKLTGACYLDFSLLNTVAGSPSPCTGSTGNTDVGLDLTAAAGSVIVLDPTVRPTVTGTAGDVRLSDGTLKTWASCAGIITTDTRGNRIIG